jgi:hypothetical protein
VARGDNPTGTLDARFELRIRYTSASCPTGTPSTFECFDRTGSGVVPGLGNVEESYAYVIENDSPLCPVRPGQESRRLPATTARLSVAGKGTIELRIGASDCIARFGFPFEATVPFTITGGSGLYSGASGGGTVTVVSDQPPQPPPGKGVDTWAGTLAVPGLQFDVTRPTISGARSKTVRAPRRAKRIRVTYSVTARDDVDGVVPAKCSPRSGSRFKLGRTRVTCTATDTSGNETTASFTVSVKRRR